MRSAIILSSLLVMAGCAAPVPTPSPTVSPSATPSTKVSSAPSPAAHQEIVEPPVSFDLPADFEESYRNDGDNYTVTYDDVSESKTAEARVMVAPYVSSGDIDSAQAILQGQFLFSGSSSNFVIEERNEDLNVPNADESLGVSYSYTGKDSVDYKGYWWLMWNEEMNRVTAVNMQYSTGGNAKPQSVVNLINSTLVYHPETLTPTGPGTAF